MKTCTDGPTVSLSTHQVLRAVQLVCGGGAACDERLEHAAHHHRLHVLRHRLVVPRGEVIAEARFVWKQQGRRQGETTDHTGGGLVIRERELLT